MTRIELRRATSREEFAMTVDREGPDVSVSIRGGVAPAEANAGADRRRVAGEFWALQRIYEAAGKPPIRVQLWTGAAVGPPDAVATLHVRNRRALLKLLTFPDYQLAACYVAGDVTVEGSLAEALEALYRATARAQTADPLPQRVLRRVYRPHDNSLSNARDNIHRHYNLGNDFYKLWLDERLVYTCAYFRRPDDTLEQAQIDKMDLVCRKLRLRPGDRVVEAGCGWGALALHIAEHYGANVTAYNIAREQIQFARQWADARRLTGRVQFIEDDYRNIHGKFDVFVSIGMLEHVGREHFADFGAAIARNLEPEGRGLIHFIGRPRPTPLNPWIERHIFPGGYPPALSEMLPTLETLDLAVLDVENLRPHYALTLEHWLARFESNVDRVRAMFDEHFVRTWRMYLAGSLAAFRAGDLQLYQLLFNRKQSEGASWTRAYLYEERPDE
jgi:cyclopropane-fatty-acyl-phospholipid synthase